MQKSYIINNKIWRMIIAQTFISAKTVKKAECQRIDTFKLWRGEDS